MQPYDSSVVPSTRAFRTVRRRHRGAVSATDWVAKAEAAAWAFRFRGIAPTIGQVKSLLKLAGQGERCIGDNPEGDLRGNWGATQRRRLTNAEKAAQAAGKKLLPKDPFEQFHGDSSPTTGSYVIWFHRSMEPNGTTPNDVRAACILVCDLMDLRGFTAKDLDALGTDPTRFATTLYDRGYYRGFTPDRADAIKTYAANLGEPTVDDALGAWSPDPLLPVRPTFYRRSGESYAEVYARAEAHYVGCDEGDGVDEDGHVYPHHRSAELVALYRAVGESPAEVSRKTNCAEFKLKLLAALGCDHPLAREPYSEALQRHPEGAVGMLSVIGHDKDAVTSGSKAWTSLSRGKIVSYAVNVDAHSETAQQVPDASTGIADHSGAGRQGNRVGWDRGDMRTGPRGMPVYEVYDTNKMIAPPDEAPRAVPAPAPSPTPSPAPEPLPVPTPPPVDGQPHPSEPQDPRSAPPDEPAHWTPGTLEKVALTVGQKLKQIGVAILGLFAAIVTFAKAHPVVAALVAIAAILAIVALVLWYRKKNAAAR